MPIEHPPFVKRYQNILSSKSHLFRGGLAGVLRGGDNVVDCGGEIIGLRLYSAMNRGTL
ncbi:hypothetical protein SDC9_55292 [bioreactor metagenome]|uniref:Uncharacterized protein n=1 Tax=bioreactor metagenome TaxID=1076179 RepID=A0A644WYI9_9ZZZZ